MSVQTGTATDYRDMLDRLDAFLTATGHAWGKAFFGVGDGDIVDYIGTAASVAETFTITMLGAANFTVSGSTTGALADGVVGTPYTSAVIDFTINAGATPFQAGDVFTIQTSPKWTRTREAGCADTTKRTSDLLDSETAIRGRAGATYASKSGQSCYIEWEMHRPCTVGQLQVQIDTTGTAPRDFSMQYRDNPGDPWVTAASWNGQTWSNTQESRDFPITPTPAVHKYWRFETTASNGSSIRIRRIYLFETAGYDYNLGDRFEIIWNAPGLDGAHTIPIGMRTYGVDDTDTWSLSIASWRQTDPGAYINSQPNGSGLRALAMINSPLGYWIIANGQRFILVVKFASLYQFAYAGFGMPYEMPADHPFPSIAAASSNNVALRYNSTDGGFRFPADPGEGGFAAFYPDGLWREHASRFTQTAAGSEGAYSNYQGKVWPTSAEWSGATQPKDIRDNLDESRPLLPVIPFHRSSPSHVWGELDGVYWTTGFNTVAEALIREQRYDHLVVNNIFRNGIQHYAAVRLD